MPTEADRFLEEDQEISEEENAADTEDTEQQEEAGDTVDWKAQFEQLNAQMAQLQSRLPQAKEPEAPKKLELTAEQKAALKDNPELIFEIVQKQTEQAQQAIARQTQKERWDEKAIKEFPIQKDKDFERAVVKEIQSLVSTGAMDKENPMLVYTAAKMAAAGYKPKNGGSSLKKPNDSGLPPGSTPRKSPVNAEKDKKDQQQRYFLKLAGWDDAKITKVLSKSDQERGVMFKGNKRRRVVQL